jgi:hypothetical protein
MTTTRDAKGRFTGKADDNSAADAFVYLGFDWPTEYYPIGAEVAAELAKRGEP